jgi:tRNA A-37 threonylcarbamoyl transferase component Bud32
MHTINFAKIRNAKALLLTPDKRVLHFPATNKVRIDNILPDELYYRSAAQRSNRKEYANANTAALETGLVPPVQNYRERGNMTSYTQDYAGKRLPNKLEGIVPKEQYKLGSQVGRIQNRLREQDLGHTDIHEGNIVRSKPNGREVKLIDNASIENIKDKYDEAELKNLYAAKRLGKPFMTGYNSRINFNSNKQMQHFANFGFEQLVGQAKNLGQQGLNKAKTLGYAAKNVAGDISRMRGTQIGAGIGAAAGLAKGAGAGETEEERASTTALGRVGKVFGNTAGGAAVGGALGLGAQVSGYPQKLGKYTRNKVADITKQPIQGELF